MTLIARIEDTDVPLRTHTDVPTGRLERAQDRHANPRATAWRHRPTVVATVSYLAVAPSMRDNQKIPLLSEWLSGNFPIGFQGGVWMSTSGDANNDQIATYRSLCWNNAIDTFGTSYVFQQRARQRKRRLQWINYVGIGAPLLVGSLVLSFGKFNLLPVIIAIAGAIGIAQIALNLWSVIGRWVEDYSYAIISIAANDSLSVRFRELGQNPPPNLDALRERYDRLQVEDTMRRDQDLQHDIKDFEQRMGMHAALRQFQRKCVGCKKVPTSMEPSDCGICGNFKYTDS
ncbi:MAG: mobilome CxxCx(11)CxxC protein [Candidatus Dormibacteraceae bacterium]